MAYDKDYRKVFWVIQKIIDERKIRMGGDIQIWENSTIVLQITYF
jgi:hypothetical protein